MDEIGIGGQRVRMFNLSSAEGSRFAALCEEMTESVRALGPSPLPSRLKDRRDGESNELAEAV